MSDLYDPETDAAVRYMVSTDITYYKTMIDKTRWALEEPTGYENHDDYQDRCSAVGTYREMQSKLRTNTE